MALSKIQGAQIETPVDISTVNITGVGTITNATITNLTGTAGTVTTLRSTTLNADTGNIVTGVTTNFTSTNGSITNLTGTAGTITTLRSTTGNFTTGNIVTGVTTNFNATNVVITGVTTVSAGTALLPSITPSGDPNTGIFFPSADTIAFTSGGTRRIEIQSDGDIDIDGGGVYYDATNNRLAIGTTTVDNRCHIATSEATTQYQPVLRLETTSTGDFGPALLFEGNRNSISGTASIAIDTSASGKSSLVYTADVTHRWIGNDKSSEYLRLDASGRLLIGTTSSSSDSVIVVQGYVGVSAGAGEISITRGGTPSIADQGLGTIKFQNNNNNTGAQIDAFSEGSWTGGSNHQSRLVFSTAANGGSSPTERMRIGQNGQTRILGAVGANGAALTWENTVNSSGAFAGVSFLGSNANNTSSYHYIASTGGADKFYVFGNGNVVNVNNSYGSLSDLKIKENIIDATSQWSDIKNLQVRKYNFKEETGHQTHTQIGLIAQEVELISPGLVNESPDRDAEGNELGTVTKSVNYSVLYMKAIKALQEAMERIEQLESAVASLQGD